MPAEADAIHDATAALHGLCVQAAHHVAERNGLLDLFGILAAWHGFVRASLRRCSMAGSTWPTMARGRRACWSATRTRRPA